MEIKMNILTYDIEEWYDEKVFRGNHKEKYAEYDEYLDKILAKLDETHTKGTFFCVGGMAREFPDVIKRIASNGHEIGCHSDRHTLLNKMSREELEEDTHKAIDSLRQCTGQDVISYRAPVFSVGKSNPWAFEILYKMVSNVILLCFRLKGISEVSRTMVWQYHRLLLIMDVR